MKALRSNKWKKCEMYANICISHLGSPYHRVYLTCISYVAFENLITSSVHYITKCINMFANTTQIVCQLSDVCSNLNVQQPNLVLFWDEPRALSEADPRALSDVEPSLSKLNPDPPNLNPRPSPKPQAAKVWWKDLQQLKTHTHTHTHKQPSIVNLEAAQPSNDTAWGHESWPSPQVGAPGCFFYFVRCGLSELAMRPNVWHNAIMLLWIWHVEAAIGDYGGPNGFSSKPIQSTWRVANILECHGQGLTWSVLSRAYGLTYSFDFSNESICSLFQYDLCFQKKEPETNRIHESPHKQRNSYNAMYMYRYVYACHLLYHIWYPTSDITCIIILDIRCDEVCSRSVTEVDNYHQVCSLDSRGRDKNQFATSTHGFGSNSTIAMAYDYIICDLPDIRHTMRC